MKIEKMIISEEIYSKRYDTVITEIKYSDLPKDLQDNDLIVINYHDHDWQHDDCYTTLKVFRKREERDNEYKDRLKKQKEVREISKKMRYENYLKLKEEFEK